MEKFYFTEQKAEVKEKIILQTSPIYLAAFATGFNMGLVMELTLFYLNTVKQLTLKHNSHLLYLKHNFFLT